MRIRCNQTSHLKNYVESKHKGMRYPCDRCEYAATKVSSMKKRIET